MTHTGQASNRRRPQPAGVEFPGKKKPPSSHGKDAHSDASYTAGLVKYCDPPASSFVKLAMRVNAMRQQLMAMWKLGD